MPCSCFVVFSIQSTCSELMSPNAIGIEMQCRCQRDKFLKILRTMISIRHRPIRYMKEHSLKTMRCFRGRVQVTQRRWQRPFRIIKLLNEVWKLNCLTVRVYDLCVMRCCIVTYIRCKRHIRKNVNLNMNLSMRFLMRPYVYMLSAMMLPLLVAS